MPRHKPRPMTEARAARVAEARKERKDRRKGTREARAATKASFDDTHNRRQERQLLNSILGSKEPLRGGISAERAVELQLALKTPAPLPTTPEEVAADKTRREEALAELEEARLRIEAAKTAAAAPVLALAVRPKGVVEGLEKEDREVEMGDGEE